MFDKNDPGFFGFGFDIDNDGKLDTGERADDLAQFMDTYGKSSTESDFDDFDEDSDDGADDGSESHGVYMHFQKDPQEQETDTATQPTDPAIQPAAAGVKKPAKHINKLAFVPVIIILLLVIWFISPLSPLAPTGLGDYDHSADLKTYEFDGLSFQLNKAWTEDAVTDDNEDDSSYQYDECNFSLYDGDTDVASYTVRVSYESTTANDIKYADNQMTPSDETVRGTKGIYYSESKDRENGVTYVVFTKVFYFADYNVEAYIVTTRQQFDRNAAREIVDHVDAASAANLQ
ncbi:hypothetical protein [Aminicella lysinilytica]|uniref:Uncharacterized protein n=1 Tax=Aminicella lysinilytica TaxID=433323 RepID=A0A4R6Q4N0_9FIRM|nr:hypothetical protein [Aminicella lysinilytica]TDP56443.1 hypothetical protein EV211_11417 [Aminicella lysinilytica]